MAKLISKTYGDALFEAAQEQDLMDLLLDEAKLFQEIMEQNKDFEQLMNHPKILKEEKLTILDNVCKDNFSKEFTGFLSIIIKKDRFSEVKEILDYFIKAVKEYKGIGIAYVTTPMALSEIQKSKVVERLLETTKYKQMEMHYLLKEDLMGGMYIQIGDRVIDSSIKTQLEELKRQLLKIQLA